MSVIHVPRSQCYRCHRWTEGFGGRCGACPPKPPTEGELIAARVLEAVTAERDAVGVERDRAALMRAGWSITETPSGWSARNTRLRGQREVRARTLASLLERLLGGGEVT